MKERRYIAIDLKSFYASVECAERGLNAMTTNLVVADESKTEKTICLAVTPPLKAYGIPGRPRLFEVIQQVNRANATRRAAAPRRKFTGESYDDMRLKEDPALAISYLIAPPRMALYMEISTRIYGVYLKYIAPEHIHVYSIDEVFIDATDYLKVYACTAHELALRMIRDVYAATGITATAGIGSNLYLCKVAMDIMAKKMPADEDGVRIAELDEMSYSRQLWDHEPLADFWRVGRGYADKLAAYGLRTMGDFARFSVTHEELLYRLFGVNAELLIDHAWGWESCKMEDIKAYRPGANSVSSGQVLSSPYEYDKARLIVHEMVDLLVLDLIEKRLVTNQIVLTLGYDADDLKNPDIRRNYLGEICVDRYGRQVPKHAHGTVRLKDYGSSTAEITRAALRLFDRIADPRFHVRRVNVTACNVLDETEAQRRRAVVPVQLELFSDEATPAPNHAVEAQRLARERAENEVIIQLRRRYGKNAILKGMNLQDGATTRERNGQIGGHSAGWQKPQADNKRGHL